MSSPSIVKSPLPWRGSLKRRAAALLCASGHVLACGDAVADHDAVAERDSAGIVIVEVTGEFPEWHVSPDTLIRLGVVDGDPSQEFHRVAHAARLSGGRTVVVDGGALEVRWFDESGEHTGSYARQGEGPGELRAISEKPLLVGDTIILYDPRNQRMLSLAPGSDLLSEERLEGDRQTRLIALRDHDIVTSAEKAEFDLSREYTRSSRTVVLLGNGPAGVDTLARLRGEDGALWVRIVDGTPVATIMMDLPFAAPLLLAAAGDAIVAVRGDEPELRFLGSDGNPVRIVRLADSARAVTAEDRTLYVTHSTQEAERRGMPAAPSAESARARLALLEEGHRMPLFDRLLVGSDDRVWVRRHRPQWGHEPQSWLIFQPDGRPAGQLQLSPGFDLMHVDRDAMTGVFTDDLDVEYVVSLRAVQ